jgi:hypothetical protein
MADPVTGGDAAVQEQIMSYIEKGAASILGQVMMDIIGEMTKDMDPER